MAVIFIALSLVAAFFATPTSANAEITETKIITMVRVFDQIKFSANFDPSPDQPLAILWGINGTPAEEIPFAGSREAYLSIRTGATTLLAGEQWGATFTGFRPANGLDWWIIPPVSVVYIPLVVAGPETEIFITDDGDHLFFAASGSIPDTLKVILGIDGLPEINLIFDKNKLATVELNGAHTFWFKADGYIVNNPYTPLGDDWYSMPHSMCHSPSCD
jgi:hypothetical protein